MWISVRCARCRHDHAMRNVARGVFGREQRAERIAEGQLDECSKQCGRESSSPLNRRAESLGSAARWRASPGSPLIQSMLPFGIRNASRRRQQRRREVTRYDAIVIGGGLVGSAIAYGIIARRASGPCWSMRATDRGVPREEGLRAEISGWSG